MPSFTRVALLSALVAPCSAWVTKSQATFGAQLDDIKKQLKGQTVDRVVQAQLGFLWTYPESTTDETGLGGGITWAWDPALCGVLMKQFKERIWFYDLVTCDDLRAAIARAFDKWAANSRYLKFIDVTAECKKLEMDFGPPTSTKVQNSSFANYLSAAHGGCPLAKIWITRFAATADGSTRRRRLSDTFDIIDEHGRKLEEPIANTNDALSAAVAVATAKTHARYTTTFRYTNGEKPLTMVGQTPTYGRTVVEAYAGTFQFNVEQICWYLDSAFCSKFHYIKKHTGGPAQANLIVSGVTYAIMALGILVYSIVVIRILCAVTGNVGEDQKEVDEDGDGKLSFCERFKAAVRELASWNPFVLALFVSLIFCPPLLQSQIFAPCFNCHDFEATALHEIGHFLGLGHPDNIPMNMHSQSYATVKGAGVNSYSTMLTNGGRTNATNCKTLWEDVQAFPLDIEAARIAAGEEGIDETRDHSENIPGSNQKMYPVKNAMMEHTTQHNPKACLTNDDLEALAVLYPDCGDYSLSVNVCHRIQLNLGMVRIMVYVLGPMLIGLGATLLFVGIVHKYADDERKEDLKKTRRLTVMNQQLARSVQEANQKAAQSAGQKSKKATRKSSKKRDQYDGADIAAESAV